MVINIRQNVHRPKNPVTDYKYDLNFFMLPIKISCAYYKFAICSDKEKKLLKQILCFVALHFIQ